MKSFVVMEPPEGGGEEAVFVRDGFSIIALAFPLVWLLWHRLWIETAFYVAAAVTLYSVGLLSGMALAAPFLSFLLALYVALEGSAIRLAALHRRGWREVGIVDAQNRDDAELRWFYDEEVPDTNGSAPVQAKPFGRPATQAIGGPALGLLDYPGGR